MIELEVPEASIRAQANAMSAGETSVRAIATPVVVAELRRLAKTFQVVSLVRLLLEDRANELEAGAR